MSSKPQLDKLLEARRRHPFGQFGTTDDESTQNGALGCTHTIWRFIIFAYTGRWYTHDQISKLAGYPYQGGSTHRGMRVSESQRLCSALHLPYVYRGNLDDSSVLRASNVGPVLLGVRYGSWPNWRGYHHQTVPAPWARPLDKAGRNQFTGFFGSHAVGFLGYLRVPTAGTFVRNDCYVMEPNHDSPARPENVPYDIVTQSQMLKAFHDTRARLGWSATLAHIPTRAPTFPGGLG